MSVTQSLARLAGARAPVNPVNRSGRMASLHLSWCRRGRMTTGEGALGVGAASFCLFGWRGVVVRGLGGGSLGALGSPGRVKLAWNPERCCCSSPPCLASRRHVAGVGGLVGGGRGVCGGAGWGWLAPFSSCISQLPPLSSVLVVPGEGKDRVLLSSVSALPQAARRLPEMTSRQT